MIDAVNSWPWWKATIRTDDDNATIIKMYADQYDSGRRKMWAASFPGVQLDLKDSFCLGPGRYQFVFTANNAAAHKFNVHYSVT